MNEIRFCRYAVRLALVVVAAAAAAVDDDNVVGEVRDLEQLGKQCWTWKASGLGIKVVSGQGHGTSLASPLCAALIQHTSCCWRRFFSAPGHLRPTASSASSMDSCVTGSLLFCK